MRFLTVDVGGSGIKYAVADENYTLRDKGTVATCYDDHQSFVEAIGRIFDRYEVDAIAMSCCGELDPLSGHMFSGGALKFNAGQNMIASVHRRCGVPVTIENDANCALLAEVHSGCLVGCANAVALVLGTGVGGAVLINQQVYRGTHFHSGNASPTRVDLTRPEAPVLADLNGAGALAEDYASRAGLPAAEVDVPLVFARCEAGDPLALEVLADYCSRLAVFIHNVQLILDVEAVAIGGGISDRARFVDSLRASMHRVFDAAPVQVPRPELRVCRYRNDANLIGAVHHHLHPER